MKSICAWCKKVIREGDEEEATHGMCDKCQENMKQEFNEWMEKNKKEVKDGSVET